MDVNGTFRALLDRAEYNVTLNNTLTVDASSSTCESLTMPSASCCVLAVLCVFGIGAVIADASHPSYCWRLRHTRHCACNRAGWLPPCTYSLLVHCTDLWTNENVLRRDNSTSASFSITMGPQ